MVLNIFKLEYNWFEGEHDEVLLAKEVERKEFEKDLVEARKFAENLKKKSKFGRKYGVECRPEFYEQIVWFLIERKGYYECCSKENVSYAIDDDFNKNISIDIIETKTERKELKY